MTTMPMPAADPGWVAHVQDRLELPRNARLRLVGDALLVVPGRSVHFRTRHALADWSATIPGVEPAGRVTLTPAVNGFTPEPEFALIRSAAWAPRREAYAAHEVLFVAEITSTEAEQRHLGDAWHVYAALSVPVLLILDVLSATWTLLTTPRAGAYAVTTTGTFGEPIPAEIAGAPHPLDASGFGRLRP